VDHVEGGDEVVVVLLAELRDVPDLEADVAEALRPFAGAGDALSEMS
jgi:hypothetical protein